MASLTSSWSDNDDGYDVDVDVDDDSNDDDGNDNDTDERCIILGGSPIVDNNRSRFSLVAHTVPEMTAVHRTNVFFDPSLVVSQYPSWDYKVRHID